MRHVLATTLLAATLFVALFGLYVMLIMPHAHGCPLMQAHEVLCANTVIEHMALWQSLMASFLILGFLFCAVPFAITGYIHAARDTRLRPPTVFRPTLLQELFAQGLLNRKAP